MTEKRSIDKRLGEVIDRTRTNAKLTQKDLADKVGVHEAAVSLWVRGKRRITVAKLIEISNALGVDPCKLLKEIL